jgi:hypothetical protein
MCVNCSQQTLVEHTVTVEIAILAGLTANVLLSWLIKRDLDEIEQVVVQMLLDLGKQGILNVEVEDDSGEA